MCSVQLAVILMVGTCSLNISVLKNFSCFIVFPSARYSKYSRCTHARWPAFAIVRRLLVAYMRTSSAVSLVRRHAAVLYNISVYTLWCLFDACSARSHTVEEQEAQLSPRNRTRHAAPARYSPRWLWLPAISASIVIQKPSR